MSRTNPRVQVDPSRIFSITVDISAPPERIWQVMTDVERWPEWTESIQKLKRLDSGAFRVGSRVRIKQPKLIPATWEVTELAPQRAFTWISRSPGTTVSAKHRIEPTSRGCRVTLSVAYGGLLGGLVAKMFGAITDRYLMFEAAGLKQRSEIIVR